MKNIVKKRRNCSFLLFSTIFLPVIRFSCLGRDQIITSRLAVIRNKRVRDSESQLYIYTSINGRNELRTYTYTVACCIEMYSKVINAVKTGHQ